jgi:single-strand DNA-binding protein
MNDTHITLHGWVGGEVRHRDVKGVSVSTLRVGVTPRVRRNGEWADGETTWYTVTAWRALADRVRDSVNVGDAVIVHGRLSTRTWTDDKGQQVTTLEVEAVYMGHDMSRGTSTFHKAERPQTNDSDLEQEVAAMVAETAAEAPAMTSWGVARAGAAPAA